MILINNGDNVAVAAGVISLTETGASSADSFDRFFTNKNSYLVDLPVPAGFEAGRFVLVDGKLVPDAAKAAELAQPQYRVDQMMAMIDAAVAERYASPQRFVVEYQEREAQARAYVNDYEASPVHGNLLPVPSRIAAFASAAGMQPYAAARLTIKQADGLRDALGKLADLRMRKYEVLRAPTPEAAKAAFDDIMAKIAAVVIP